MSSTTANTTASRKSNAAISKEITATLSGQHFPKYDPRFKQREFIVECLKKPEKLEKEMKLLERPPPTQKELPKLPDIVRHVTSSNAGCGSGEFHIYRNNRRREEDRLNILQEMEEEKKAQLEFEAKKREREEKLLKDTSKRRAKRQKRKAAKKQKEGDEKKGESGSVEDEENEDDKSDNDANLN